MKIAIIVNPLIPVPPEQYGGIERIIYMLIQELIKTGHDVTLYAHPDSKPGCKLIPYSEEEHYSLKDFIRINRITAKIAHQGFDLVHTFGRMSNIALLMLSKIPKVVSYQLPPTVSQVKKAVKIARLHSLHFTACSNYIAGQIKDYCDVITIYNGVDIADYQCNDKMEADAPLVFLGRIQKEKGTAIAIQLAKKTKRKLIIAGNIPAEAIHQQYFNEEVKPFIDGEQINYIGPVNNVQKNELLRKAYAFLMPVLWDEPFGIVMTEALACGAPVIGFRRGAVPEVVTNGLNGFVCDTFDEMVIAIEHIGDISCTACRQVVEERFSSTVLAKQYETLYKQLIGK
ncbi:glycosyltransferase involved in cell wall biosynthesis [Mucilaginibacter frigoritolerans]|uniref:Glycosyltransferase involved in cell wall biosynthesis n=1 Tax=Mucilaginibacter frigoritolerans TaxID=652788 RepID=A0A562U179_9SPHI|nr:glycosyltransferase family 4 protein [Mucilaginibacter frigoritolerans]TWI99248.1 glycosyltransferase involved in cell wall biosynthesis [Mucilaginibacter frigoritolerans]